MKANALGMHHIVSKAHAKIQPTTDAPRLPPACAVQGFWCANGAFIFVNATIQSLISFAVPYLFLSLIWTQPTFGRFDAGLLAVVLASPFLCAILSCMFLPLGLLEAVRLGWCRTWPASAGTFALHRVRPSIKRHFFMALVLFVPNVLVALSVHVYTSPLSKSNAVVFASTYIALLTFQAVSISLTSLLQDVTFRRIREEAERSDARVMQYLRVAKACVKDI